MTMKNETSLKKLAFDGIKWQVAANTVNRVISFAGMLVLARFLGPSVFGLYALTMSVVNSFELFKSMGLDTALIRRKEQFELSADTAFAVIPVLGLVLYCGLALSAGPVARMFHAPELEATMRVLGIAFVCNCFTRVPSAILERRMEFKDLSIAELVSNGLFPLIAVPLALAGAGVWSLVVAYVVKMLVYMVMVWRHARWMPALRFSPRIAAEMFAFGKFIFLSSVVYFLRMNLDNILVGKYLGVTMLGLYALAFNIANFAADYLGVKVHRVIYSAYSRIDKDEALVSAFLKTLKYLSMVAFPVGVGIMLFGDELVAFAYGPKWLAAGSALKVLALAGIFNTLPVGVMPAFLTKGKPFLSFLITSGQVVIFIFLIGPAARMMGIQGVAMVVSSASFAGMCASFFFIRRLLNVRVAQFQASLMPALVSSLSMVAVAVVLRHVLMPYRGFIGVYVSFAAVALCAAASYGIVLIRLEKTLLKEIREVAL